MATFTIRSWFSDVSKLKNDWLSDVVSKGDNVDGVVYKVCQDASLDDVYEVKAKDVVGVATTHYETAGKIIKLVTSYVGMAICIALPLLLLIFIEIIISIAKHASAGKYEQEDDDDWNTEQHPLCKTHLDAEEFLELAGQDDERRRTDQCA